MVTKVNSFEQSGGQFVAGLYCAINAKGVAATIVKRANTALAIGNALATLSSGDIGTASAAILNAVQNNPSLDPAMALALKNALQVELLQWQALSALGSQIPFISSSIEEAIGNFGAGVVSGAQAELAKYANAPASSSSSGAAQVQPTAQASAT